MILVRSNATVVVEGYPRLDSYRVVDQRTIVLTVAVAPRSWTRMTSVAETPTEVRVRIESLEWPISDRGRCETPMARRSRRDNRAGDAPLPHSERAPDRHLRCVTTRHLHPGIDPIARVDFRILGSFTHRG